jgi:hypothetical protein
MSRLPRPIRFLTALAQVSLGTLALGAVGWSDDEEPVGPAPDLTTVALIILAVCLFVANLGGIWWLALSFG